MAVGPAAAVSGRVGGGGAVHSVVRGEKRPRFRVARMGYCGVHYVSFLLYQADGEILQGGEAVQLGAEGGGLMEAHSAADEVPGDAGASRRSVSGGRDPRESFLCLRRPAGFLRAEPDGPSGGYHRRYRAGGLRQVHLRAGVPLRSALRRLGKIREDRVFRPHPPPDRGDCGIFGARPGAERRHHPE